jgi:hypothetical protein
MQKLTILQHLKYEISLNRPKTGEITLFTVHTMFVLSGKTSLTWAWLASTTIIYNVAYEYN